MIDNLIKEYIFRLLAEAEQIGPEHSLSKNVSWNDNMNGLLGTKSNTELLAAVRKEMETGGNLDELIRVAQEPGLHRDVYLQLAQGGFHVRVALADNHSVPSDILDTLNDDKYHSIQSHLAKNPNLSPAAQLHIAGVRQAAKNLLDNPNLTEEALEAIVLGKNVRNSTKWFAISHSLMTKGLLFKLARSDDQDLREKATAALKEKR